MTDHTAFAQASPVEAVRIHAWVLPTRFVWAITIIACIAAASYLVETEGWSAGLFAMAAMATVGAVLVGTLQRLLPAVVLVSAAIAIIRSASSLTQQKTEVLLHAYDVMSLGSWPAMSQFARAQGPYALALLIAVITAVVFAWIAFRVDATRIRRVHSAGVAGLFLLVTLFANVVKGERRHTEFYFENTYVSYFLASWAEALEAWRRGSLMEAAPSAPHPKFGSATLCESRAKPPHIILIHQESVVPPSHFASLSYDRSLDTFFASQNRQLYKLRVETFGGASWLTEFSVLTGLSTYSFGGMRQIVQHIMAGKVKDTLPAALARCGYRNVVFYPMLRRFLGAERFFAGVGLHEIYDAKDQTAKAPNERDRFYYSNLLSEIERHTKASSRPLFAYLETMATHGAYDYTYMPEVDVPGGGPGTSPEMHEYLRRLAMASIDYAFLRGELTRRFPGDQFLIIHYGDHQPTAAWTLLGLRQGTTIDQVMQSNNATALTTYFAVDAVRYQPPALPAIDSLAVPYLGTIILEAARLPLSDAHRARRRLMLLCKGRYHDCPLRDEVLGFQSRLIDAGIVDAR